jgi:hypothetical protein
MTAELSPPRFVLPGTWARVDLANESTIRATVRKVVDDAVGRRDDQARLRRELRDAITAAAAPARERGAVEFHFARELTAGIPLSATLAVFVVRADLAPMTDMPAGAIDLTVADAVAPAGPVGRADVSPGIRATRTTSRRLVPDREGVPGHEILEVDYWISAAAPARIAVLSFSTALSDLEDDMLQLFGAIVQTVRWDAPVAP